MSNTDIHKKRARLIFWQWIAIGCLTLYMIVGTTISLYSAFQSYHARQVIIDCVSPDGQCFSDNQKRTGSVVEVIVEKYQLTETETRTVIITSIACNKLPGVNTVDEVESCVEDQTGIDLETRKH